MEAKQRQQAVTTTVEDMEEQAGILGTSPLKQTHLFEAKPTGHSRYEHVDKVPAPFLHLLLPSQQFQMKWALGIGRAWHTGTSACGSADRLHNIDAIYNTETV